MRRGFNALCEWRLNVSFGDLPTKRHAPKNQRSVMAAVVNSAAEMAAQGSGGSAEPVASSSKRKRSASVDEAPVAKSGKDESRGLLRVKVLSPAMYTASRASTTFQQPAAMASFSYDEARRLHHDDRSRKFYHPPPARADLNRGFDELVERDDTVNEHLDSLLFSLIRLLSSSSTSAKETLQKAKLITWRGMMTKLCTVLYEDRQDFAMNVMMVGNTLYLEEHKEASSSERERERQRTDPKLKRFGYYGYSFESWTCHHDQRPADPWDGNVNTNVQWCTIVKTKSGDTRCILAGEVDAVNGQTGAPIEVKTSMQIRSPRDEERFETKMLRFYMQSFLLGIAIVVVGFRDHRGLLVTHQELPTLTMPRAVRGKPHAWDPIACLNFANELIVTIRGYVADRMQKAKAMQPLPLAEAEKYGSYPVFRLRYSHQSREVHLTELEPDEILREVKGGKEDGRVGFLLGEYYDMII